MHMRDQHHNERGFVLVASLVVLMILTVMLIGLYLRNKSNQESSISARASTQAYYLAEAGLNYITWALYWNPGSPGSNNTQDLDGVNGPDNSQLKSEPNQAASSKPLKYLDLADKIGYDPTNPSATTLAYVLSNMPSHVALDITLNPTGSPSVSPEPFGSGTAQPSGDGAVVWLVPAVLDNSNPLKEVDSNVTSGSYALYAYSIGYVHGKALRVLRAKIGTVSTGFPNNLGAITNGFNP